MHVLKCTAGDTVEIFPVVSSGSRPLSSIQVFLKEKERQLLQDTLNKEVMRHIIILQRWFRACLMRSHFLQKRDATLIIQVQLMVKNTVHLKKILNLFIKSIRQ